MSDIPEPSDPGLSDLAEHRSRMKQDWDNLIEELIENGRQQGVFDNLPGKGKPLNLKRNPYAPETELAHDLLRQNDLKPAWIMQRQELNDRAQAIRTEIGRQWLRLDQEYRLTQSASVRSRLEIRWDDACLQWEAAIKGLNKQIADFNLKRPSSNTEIFKLELERELKQVGARRWLRNLSEE